MELSKNALKVLQSRYLLKNADGTIIESPQQLFKRVASYIAQTELKYGKTKDVKKWQAQFFKIMSGLKFLPNSPTLMNAGTNEGQLSACFVLPIGDSLESIFTTLKHAALIHQSGGGTGFNFSALRPKGNYTSSNSGATSGPISFMKIFDVATEYIKQGGKRRGANMGIINIDHPDIEEFIKIKTNEKELKNFNISVGIYDRFMEAVLKNADWKLKHPTSKKNSKKINARYLWGLITENAWQTGDPGLVFINTINKKNPTPELGTITCTNPCGEVPLLPYEACNLGSIDVAKFVDKKNKKINWKELERTITIAIRFLDNVIEMNDYLLPEINTLVKGNRKIGLGIMGWANLLISLEIPYASAKAISLAKQLMKFINNKSANASFTLAKERGAFQNWKKSIYYPTTPMRNATRTSIAPTGTISIIANTSSSIEPLFALASRRENVLNNETLSEINPLFIQYLKTNDLYSKKIIDHVLQFGTIENTQLPKKVKHLFKTALEIIPEWHLKHQIAFQQYTDNAVSKTINLPQNALVKDISDIYIHAWKQKAKGITVFRNNSKQKQVLYQGVQTESASCKICRE